MNRIFSSRRCRCRFWRFTIDAGAALCRSIGKTNVAMNISIVANGINVIGNCVGVFALHMGAAGVAYRFQLHGFHIAPIAEFT